MMDWIRRWGPAIFFMVVIFLFSAMPGAELPDLGGWDIFAKKGGHMLGYALLASAYCYAINTYRSASRLQYILALCMATLYAVSDEWHQKYIPGRNSSFYDVCIDTAGGLIGIAIFYFVRKRFYAQPAAVNTVPK
jgi:VanZ family protein